MGRTLRAKGGSSTLAGSALCSSAVASCARRITAASASSMAAASVDERSFSCACCSCARLCAKIGSLAPGNVAIGNPCQTRQLQHTVLLRLQPCLLCVPSWHVTACCPGDGTIAEVPDIACP